MARLYTPTELDNLISLDAAVVVAVDAPEAYWPECVLTGVYTDGRFDVIILSEGPDVEKTLNLRDCKVFLVRVS